MLEGLSRSTGAEQCGPCTRAAGVDEGEGDGLSRSTGACLCRSGLVGLSRLMGAEQRRPFCCTRVTGEGEGGGEGLSCLMRAEQRVSLCCTGAAGTEVVASLSAGLEGMVFLAAGFVDVVLGDLNCPKGQK